MLTSKPKSLIFLLWLIHTVCYTQNTNVEKGKFELELIHARKLSKIQANTSIILKSDKLKTIFIKLRMTAKNGKRQLFDINKFSLVDDTHMIRSRPIDISCQTFTAFENFGKLLKDPPKKKNSILPYNPAIKDSFTEYKFEGYNALEIPLDYDGWGKRENQIIYFRPRKFKTKKLNFFFPFPKKSTSGILYYGDEMVARVKFK